MYGTASLPQGGEYDPELGFMDPFHHHTPSTGTSVLSSIPRPEEDIDEDEDSELTDSYDRGYSMGPILQAMLGEWERGDEVLKTDKKRLSRTSEGEP